MHRLRHIDSAAGQLFVAIGMHDIAAQNPPPVAELLAYQATARAWVAAGADARAMAYMVVDQVDGCAHVEQLSVHPEVARQGIGARLLDTAAAYAAAEGLVGLTLLTFRKVAWNQPYYERLGFRPLPDNELGPGLSALRDAEPAKGLDPAQRVCMRRDV